MNYKDCLKSGGYQLNSKTDKWYLALWKECVDKDTKYI
jgi:hypothetical protein